jgi:hypothetical protein
VIRAGDRVYIKPEWQDAGDDRFTWIAVTDETRHGWVDIATIEGADQMFWSHMQTRVSMLSHSEPLSDDLRAVLAAKRAAAISA